MTRHKVFVWDIPVRLFHWTLVLAVAYSWYAIEIMEDLERHFLAGYCILTLILFRVVWGFVGTHYARFRSFIYPVRETLAYFKALGDKTGRSYPGHSPAGGLSVLAMLLLILVQATTGLFSTDEYYFGPLNALVSESMAATITEIHHLNSDLITALIALHILAILFYRLYKNERLVAAMISGRKRIQGEGLKSSGSSKLLLAGAVLCACAGCVYLLANTSFESEQSAPEYNFY